MSFPLLVKNTFRLFPGLTFFYVLEFRIPFVWKNLVHKDKNQSQESFVWLFRFYCLNVWLSVVKAK